MDYVSINGEHLAVCKEVLDELDLHDGQPVTENQMWAVIAAKSASFVRAMEKRTLDGKYAPDTTELKQVLGMKGRLLQ